VILVLGHWAYHEISDRHILLFFFMQVEQMFVTSIVDVLIL